MANAEGLKLGYVNGFKWDKRSRLKLKQHDSRHLLWKCWGMCSVASFRVL